MHWIIFDNMRRCLQDEWNAIRVKDFTQYSMLMLMYYVWWATLNYSQVFIDVNRLASETQSSTTNPITLYWNNAIDSNLNNSTQSGGMLTLKVKVESVHSIRWLICWYESIWSIFCSLKFFIDFKHHIMIVNQRLCRSYFHHFLKGQSMIAKKGCEYSNKIISLSNDMDGMHAHD